MSEHAFTFPLDIERLIIEYAAREDNRTALRLALVSRCAQSWSVENCVHSSIAHSSFPNSFSKILRVEPIIYRFVDLHSVRAKKSFLESLEVSTKPRSFYNRCIKILFVPFDHTPAREWDDGIETVIKLLPYCQGVEYLFWWICPDRKDARLVDLLSNMRPKRLDADFINLLGSTQSDFSLPFFDNITHLVVSEAPPNWTAIQALPCLSHLLIDWIHKYVMPNDSDLLKVAADVLSHCKTLKVCAIRYPAGR